MTNSLFFGLVVRSAAFALIMLCSRPFLGAVLLLGRASMQVQMADADGLCATGAGLQIHYAYVRSEV